ncbi:DUF5753 domain-containing protein [Streptomyces sp. NPDC006372]|uniref:DUF5753 domain-containing protein n=1 Tax=Streptomyces sp. NPDC006372 TaxID=3155599 RepID=UPI0033B39AFA
MTAFCAESLTEWGRRWLRCQGLELDIAPVRKRSWPHGRTPRASNTPPEVRGGASPPADGWLEDLENKYDPRFAAAAELERHATLIQQFALALVPGLLQTPDYARAVFAAYRLNRTDQELDRHVVIRTERARILDGPSAPVVWTLLDEAVLRRCVGGPQVMAEQLHKIADLAEARRIRLHVLPYRVGAHALMESLLTLMSFEDSAPVAYVDAFETGRLMDDPPLVSACQTAYALALSDALSQQESLALVRSAAEEHTHDQQ